MSRIRTIITLALAIFASAGCGGQQQPPAIFLGHIATFSGSDARPGKSAEHGIRIALEDLGPDASKALGDRPLVVRHVDAAGNLDNMEGEAARLVSVNKVVGLLGGLTRDEALRLDRSRVPVLAAIGLRTSAMSELLFTTGLAPSVQGRALAEFLLEQSTVPGTLIVDPRRDESLTAAESFHRGWHNAWQKQDAKGDSPPWRELALPKDVKHAEWATAVIKDEPKTIVYAGAAADFEALRKAWATHGAVQSPRLVFAGDDGSWMPPEPVAGQPVVVATAFALGKDQTKALEFAKKFRTAAGTDPDVHAALAYDNVRLFAEALKKCDLSAPDKLREELRAELLKLQDFPGLTGPLSFGRDQHLRRIAFVATVDSPLRAPIAVKSFNP
ncbi:MAG: ABC transporter substrate-binding protein [Gemmataceae bacterium]|nr:ABC transporter substrate-binding protein [Gemmataceae bacterium]